MVPSGARRQYLRDGTGLDARLRLCCTNRKRGNDDTMMKLLPIVMCFAVGVSAAAEDSAPDGSAPRSAQGSQSGNETVKTGRAAETTATGCLLGQDGKYILITAKQSSILQLRSSPNLEVHVGHKVKLTGTIENIALAKPDASHDDNPQAGASTAAHASADGQLRVRKIKTISSACDAKSEKPSRSWIRLLNL